MKVTFIIRYLFSCILDIAVRKPTRHVRVI